MEESGWKMVAGDVFRPPRSVTLLCVQVGSGIQITASFFITLFFAALGARAAHAPVGPPFATLASTRALVLGSCWHLMAGSTFLLHRQEESSLHDSSGGGGLAQPSSDVLPLSDHSSGVLLLVASGRSWDEVALGSQPPAEGVVPEVLTCWAT